MSNIRLDYTGIVIGRVRRESGEQNIIVCAASKIRKRYSLLLLEIIYPADEFAQVEIPANGAIISGAGQLCKIEDDFIGIHPQSPLKILPSDSKVDFDGKPWRSNHFPAAATILIRQTLRKSKHCLDMNLDWEWQSPYAPCKAFSQLLSSTLNDATSSLVTVWFSGLVLAGHKAHGATHKNYLCLTTKQNPDYVQLPLLIDCEFSNSSCHITRGDIIEVSEAPVLSVKNDLRILLMQCGQGHWAKEEKDSADLHLLSQIYDELINLGIGEDAFWPALFRRKPKALFRQMLKQAYAKLDGLGIQPTEIVHGWWHSDWVFSLTFMMRNCCQTSG